MLAGDHGAEPSIAAVRAQRDRSTDAIGRSRRRLSRGGRPGPVLGSGRGALGFGSAAAGDPADTDVDLGAGAPSAADLAREVERASGVPVVFSSGSLGRRDIEFEGDRRVQRGDLVRVFRAALGPARLDVERVGDAGREILLVTEDGLPRPVLWVEFTDLAEYADSDTWIHTLIPVTRISPEVAERAARRRLGDGPTEGTLAAVPARGGLLVGNRGRVVQGLAHFLRNLEDR